jgi:hypothetical protein
VKKWLLKNQPEEVAVFASDLTVAGNGTLACNALCATG